MLHESPKDAMKSTLSNDTDDDTVEAAFNRTQDARWPACTKKGCAKVAVLAASLEIIRRCCDRIRGPDATAVMRTCTSGPA